MQLPSLSCTAPQQAQTPHVQFGFGENWSRVYNRPGDGFYARLEKDQFDALRAGQRQLNQTMQQGFQDVVAAIRGKTLT